MEIMVRHLFSMDLFEVCFYTEFMKTLMLMEATLVAENEEIITRRDRLNAAITREKDLIDSYKVDIYSSRTT